VTELGYECVNVALGTEDGKAVLRILIDSLGGINVSDCEKVSKAANRCLDALDAGELSERYYLEVSSPGLERPLFKPDDYKRFKDKEARVKTQELIGGRKTHIGFIRVSDETSVTLETEKGMENIPFSAVTRAALVFRGLEPQGKKQGRNKNPKKAKSEEEDY